jgi:hypothetical protein
MCAFSIPLHIYTYIYLTAPQQLDGSTVMCTLHQPQPTILINVQNLQCISVSILAKLVVRRETDLRAHDGVGIHDVSENGSHGVSESASHGVLGSGSHDGAGHDRVEIQGSHNHDEPASRSYDEPEHHNHGDERYRGQWRQRHAEPEAHMRAEPGHAEPGHHTHEEQEYHNHGGDLHIREMDHRADNYEGHDGHHMALAGDPVGACATHSLAKFMMMIRRDVLRRILRLIVVRRRSATMRRGSILWGRVGNSDIQWMNPGRLRGMLASINIEPKQPLDFTVNHTASDSPSFVTDAE